MSTSDQSVRLYQHLVRRLQLLIRATLPPEANVFIISKGDSEMLQLDVASVRHFPQGLNGEYAGYHPADSSEAIRQLETARRFGGDHLIVPAPSFWWLDFYSEFAKYLRSNYPVVVQADGLCLCFNLKQRLSGTEQTVVSVADSSAMTGSSVAGTAGTFKREPLDCIRSILDLDYYGELLGRSLSEEEAVQHHAAYGCRDGFSPTPLFDPVYYASHYLNGRVQGVDPLIHFLESAPVEARNPSAYFDADYYYRQNPMLQSQGVNSLVHYLGNGGRGRACRPNPLFANGFYLDSYEDIRTSGESPFGHFVKRGLDEGRYGSLMHQRILEDYLGFGGDDLVRGGRRAGWILLLSDGVDGGLDDRLGELSRGLEETLAFRCRLIFLRQPAGAEPRAKRERQMTLEALHPDGELLRASALRLLVRLLRRLEPRLILSTSREWTLALSSEEIPSYLAPEEFPSAEAGNLWVDYSKTTRLLGQKKGRLEVCVGSWATLPTGGVAGAIRDLPLESLVDGVAELAATEGSKVESVVKRAKRLIIPCSDWALSGVNTALEGIGNQLIRAGWSVELVFTRNLDEGGLREPVAVHRPALPYRQLVAGRPGVAGMWASLISYLEQRGPCVVLLSYDFVANAVASALSNQVGVVCWLQSDDLDYYEQAYRLGRYCNRIVCVSPHIQRTAGDLNPALKPRSVFIPNSSVSINELNTSLRRPMTEKLRLVYSGRLVQYQKRILDVIPLANALDEAGVPFEIALIGSFCGTEATESTLRRSASRYLDDGRMRLLGRLSRSDVLRELRRYDFFLLLSDFEGMPLALIEAMAQGCVPVVATMQSGIPELVRHGENGLIVEGRNYAHWVDEIRGCWANPDGFGSLSRSAVETIRHRYTVEEIGVQFAEMLEGVLQEVKQGHYQRPKCLNWGPERSPHGDVLPPPSILQLPPSHLRSVYGCSGDKRSIRPKQ